MVTYTKKVKYVCTNCKEVKYYSIWEVIKEYVLAFFLFLGLMTFIAMTFIGPQTFFGTMSSGIMFKMAGYQSKFDARAYALNHTSLDGRDSYEFAKQLFYNMPHLRYVPASFFKPIPRYEDIISYGGDCKAFATLFVKLMNEAGYRSVVDCNLDKQHCVAKIFYEGDVKRYYGTYMIVDLTGDYYLIYNKDKSFWDFDKPLENAEK